MKRVVVCLVFVVAGALLFAGGQGEKEGATPGTSKEDFIIFHFWTVGGEKEALDTLYQLFLREHPEANIIENPVAGGGGVNMTAVLMANLAAGMPPDTFQGFGGNWLKEYVDAGYLEPIDDIWSESQYGSRIHPAWPQALKVNGHPYGIAMQSASDNMLWYNPKIHKDAGIEPASDFNTILENCKKIKAAIPNVWPLGMATREKLWSIYYLDAMLKTAAIEDMGREDGLAWFEKAQTGRIDYRTDPTFRKAIEQYATSIPYMYPWHSTKTWDEASAQIVNGETAMLHCVPDCPPAYWRSIGGYTEGIDWGGVEIPRGTMSAHADVFPLCKGAPNPRLGKAWLKILASHEGQERFNVVKGGVACVQDVKADVYPDEWRRKMARLYLSSPPLQFNSFHGGMFTPGFSDDVMNILTTFLADPNVNKVVSDFADAVERNELREACSWYWEGHR